MSKAIARVSRPAAVPHGFTIVTWSSGALGVSIHGVPGIVGVVLFAVGGLAAYGVTTGLGGRPDSASDDANPLPRLTPAGAAAVAIGVNCPLAFIPGPIAWLALAFVGTASYFLVLSLMSHLSRTTSIRKACQ